MRRKRRVGVARTVADDDAARKGWRIDVERGEGPRRGVRARGERRRRGEPRRARGDEANARVVVDEEKGHFDDVVLSQKQMRGGWSERLKAQLEVMLYEYIFRDNIVSSARAFPWKISPTFVGGAPRLVPQLLQYSLFHLEPVPDEWKKILAQP